MLRILRSTLTVPASDPGTTFINADITQADLEAAVPVGGSVLPLALIFDPEDTNVTVKEVVLANTKNEEGQMSLVPAGDALSLAGLNKVLAPKAGGMDARRLTVAHGARLKIKAVNATGSPINISILWKVDNAHAEFHTKGDTTGNIKGDPNTNKGSQEEFKKEREMIPPRDPQPLFKGQDPNL